MSITYIPGWTKLCLWGRAGGRCQYDGCNRMLYRDDVTQAEFNAAYIAHIIADKPDGPRGDPLLSEQLKQDIGNLMLVCDAHHRLVDIADVKGHSADRLRAMKRRHEERIELLTSIAEDKRSHILLYGARIGEHDAPLTFNKAAAAMIPGRSPAAARAIELSLKNSIVGDSEPSYWEMEGAQLRRQFAAQVRPMLAAGDIHHLSVFAFAPIPLLVELGRLLSDIPAADVFQLHREPPDWKWQRGPASFAFEVSTEGVKTSKTVAVALALSANVAPKRIHRVLGDDVAIWTVTHNAPGNDFLKTRTQLQAFRETLRQVLNQIKTAHGEDAHLHMFPAVPVSVAVEIGRVWMPKADLPFRVYDQQRSNGGFTVALNIPPTA
jgi:SMODS-associated and fused to various effectors sensor domain